MAVPQDAPPLCRNLGRRGNTVRIRREKSRRWQLVPRNGHNRSLHNGWPQKKQQDQLLPAGTNWLPVLPGLAMTEVDGACFEILFRTVIIEKKYRYHLMSYILQDIFRKDKPL